MKTTRKVSIKQTKQVKINMTTYSWFLENKMFVVCNLKFTTSKQICTIVVSVVSCAKINCSLKLSFLWTAIVFFHVLLSVIFYSVLYCVDFVILESHTATCSCVDTSAFAPVDTFFSCVYLSACIEYEQLNVFCRPLVSSLIIIVTNTSTKK